MSRESTESIGPLQENLQPDGPFGDIGTATDRGKNGRFVTGNRAALVTGARSVQFWQAVATERTRLRDAMLRDRGFSEADAPIALQVAADGAAQSALLRDGLFARLIEVGGPLTSSDGARRVLREWGAAADRALRHVQAIGLDRVEKDIGGLFGGDA